MNILHQFVQTIIDYEGLVSTGEWYELDPRLKMDKWMGTGIFLAYLCPRFLSFLKKLSYYVTISGPDTIF